MHSLQDLQSGKLAGNKHLRLSSNLTELPHEVFSLAETLEVLDLSANRLSSLPEDFGRLSKLKIVFFSENLFTEFPEVLRDCPELDMIGFKSNQIEHISENALPVTTRWLILTNNNIHALPRSIGNCSKLQKVGLTGNRLNALPEEMRNCKNLELLRISANQLTALPEWLLQLPKLSWLAFAGNPFSQPEQPIDALEQINWSEFELLEQLGEGASGHIYKALWLTKQIEVAIKIFKGEVTSDGLPQDEMLACIAAGSHSHLVKLIGKIQNHPQEKQGLVMELIPPSFYNLGMPPSLVTCSRDTFEIGTIFKSEQILNIAKGIASAAKQLHDKGLMHGDLYAHNILIDKTAMSLMGDFGAASFYNKNDVSAKALQQVESRAFGCLLDDLLTRIDFNDQHLTLTQLLMKLRDDCMNEKINMRPFFYEIESFLKK